MTLAAAVDMLREGLDDMIGMLGCIESDLSLDYKTVKPPYAIRISLTQLTPEEARTYAHGIEPLSAWQFAKRISRENPEVAHLIRSKLLEWST